MTKRLLAAVLVLPSVVACQTPAMRLEYPETKTVNQVDDYSGTAVRDPYRWLEDTDSPETRAWVEAQNKVTSAFLEQIPERERIRKRLTELWNYERYGLPSREGKYYIYSRNDGLQNQSVIYKTASLEGTPQVLLDPNVLSPDGTVALSSMAFSEDGKRVAYSLAASGSDWVEWKVRDVESGQDLADHLKWSKFGEASWLKDGSGFFYNRYDAPKDGDALTGINKNQRVYFHAVGTPQEKDTLVYERPDKPDWLFDAQVTDDGRFLLVAQAEGTETKNRIFIKDLTRAGARIEPFLDAFDAEYVFIGNDGNRFYFRTDRDAPRRRLVAIERDKPHPDQWRTLIPEASNRDVLGSANIVSNVFVTVWRVDAHEKIRLHNLDGSFAREIELPTMGAVSVRGKRKDREAFYSFTSFTYPTSIHRYDLSAQASTLFRAPKVAFRAEDYETTQAFYASKDGTKIPIFITHRKGITRDGQNPTYLYGYGGFNISMTPGFSAGSLAWLEMGGIYAVPNIRGGGEYGREWHDAGRLKNKQNVFDDFIAAAEYLIREKYTSTPKLAIGGGSNGGLLVGACLNQRPELFGAALPAVGVMDMLRFHKFTIGWAWTSDYGSSESKEGFDVLITYSPLHNIKPGVAYPPTLITTADHDDRVVPGHSFKYAAALQPAQAGQAPVLIRIETEAGHGAGRPTTKIIEERADQWAFLVKTLSMDPPPLAGP